MVDAKSDDRLKFSGISVLQSLRFMQGFDAEFKLIIKSKIHAKNIGTKSKVVKL